MARVLSLLFALFVGYVIGWVQFSSTSAPQIAPVQSDDVTRASVVNQDDGKTVKSILGQLDGENINEQAVETLAGFESINYTDLASLALSPTVEKVSNIIDGMNESELRLALNSITSFDDGELTGIDDTNKFAKRLLSTALFKENNVQSNVAKVSFGPDVKEDNSIKNPKVTFPADASRIYASFRLQTFPPNVFVKWFREVPYKVKLFNKYKISSTSNNNFIWYQPKSWEPGLYTVEVYSIDADLTLLAAGSYDVIE